MFDEPHICKKNYMQAEVVVLADSVEEAIELLKEDDTWNIEELKRLDPKIVNLNEPGVLSKIVYSG